jgi:hypothetical protein
MSTLEKKHGRRHRFQSAAVDCLRALWEVARAAQINEKYARRFLHVLIAEKLISVVTFPREGTKSALGYVQNLLAGNVSG